MKTSELIAVFFGMILIASLPGVLLIEYPFLLKFVIPYVVVMLPYVLIIFWLIYKQKSLKSPTFKAIGALFFLVPFIILASFPFSAFNFGVIVALIILGVGLPFWNRSFTLWLYTLGNRVPLPTEHNWLLGKNEPLIKNNNAYKNFIKNSMGWGPSVALIILYILRNTSDVDSNVLFILMIISLVVILGISLALGADFKKRSL